MLKYELVLQIEMRKMCKIKIDTRACFSSPVSETVRCLLDEPKSLKYYYSILLKSFARMILVFCWETHTIYTY